MGTEKGVLSDAFFISVNRYTRFITLLIKSQSCAIQFQIL